MPLASTSWKKGQSGNPKGKPKKEWTWYGTLKEIAERVDPVSKKDFKTAIGEVLYREALKGNIQAIRELLNRIDGLPTQRTEITGKDGKDLPMPILGAMTQPKDKPKE